MNENLTPTLMEIAEMARRLDAELVRHRDDLAAERRLAGELLRRQSEFLRMWQALSHDASGPLTEIAFIAEALEKTNPDDARILDSAREKLLDLLGEFAAIARYDEPATRDRFREISLPDFLEKIRADFARAHPGAGLRIALAPIPPLPGIAPDLRRAVWNLLENAARHAAGEILLDLEPVSGGVEIRVADDGPGVPVAAREKVFDFGFSESGGRGIGLAVAAKVAAGHGGSIRLADAPIGGAEFTIFLPTKS